MRKIENPPSLNGLMTTVVAETPYLPEADVTVAVNELTEEDRNEVLGFLAERPVQTVCLAGLIRDNGLVSPHNRGTFYGCRNSEGRLEGVALIGHATLIEARTDRAMQEMRLACREMLFEVRRAMQMQEEVAGLRRATFNDLDKIAPIQAGMAECESGINPLDVDPEGFRARCARRIEMGRVWIVEDGGRLIFKADVQSDTPDVVYLEGVWVNPSDRGKGLGRQCMRQLCQDLLTRTKAVCVLVNEKHDRAHTLYRMCNFKMRGLYDSIFLHQADASELAS